MSKTVDERVVSMQFDNKQFEANVNETINSLEKLKRSLKLEDSAKSFDNLNRASSNVSFDKIASGVESLERRFSTLGIVGMRVIENLTDSAMRLFNKATSFLTSGIVNGGITRAMNLENAHFQLQGLLKDEEEVSAVMENVNASVDQTAYSMDAAAKVASQLAASGMRAGDEMFSSLRAVAGVAAMTNSSYEDIGRIFTQVAGQGRLMGDQLLQLSGRGMNAAATLADYLTKVGNGAKVTEAQVRDMVSKGKIDFKTFAAAMDDAFGEHAKKANETFNGALSNIKAALARIGALFVAPLVEQNGALVKLFTAVRLKINEVKEAIGPLAEFFVSGVKAMATALTKFIEKINVSKWFSKLDALKSPFSDLAEKIKKVTGVTKSMSDTAKKASEKLKNLDTVVKEVISGKWGVAQKRWDALSKAGYNWATVQNKVNEELGSSVRHSEELASGQTKVQKATKETTDVQAKNTAELLKLSDAQLKALGFTNEEVKSLRDLEKQAEKAGIPIEEVLKDLSKLEGKNLLIDSFMNIGKSLVTVFKSIKDAWNETFDPIFTATGLYDLIASFHKFTTKLVLSKDQAEKLKTTFKGLFAILDIVLTLVGGPLKIVFNILKKILEGLNLNILDATSAVAEAIIKFRDWLDDTFDLSAIFEALVPYIKDAAKTVKSWITALKDSEIVKNIVTWLKDSSEAFREWVAGVKDAENVPQYILQGIVNGLKKGAESVWNGIVVIAQGLIDKVKSVLGIHSPSVEFTQIGENVMSGFANGIQNGAKEVWNRIKTFVGKIGDFFSGLNWGSALAAGLSIGSLVAVFKGIETLNKFAAPFEGAGAALSGLGDMFEGLGKKFKAEAWDARAKAVKNMAIAVAILVASLYVLVEMCKGTNSGDLWTAVGILAILVAIVGALALACSRMDKSITKIDKTGFSKSGSAVSSIIGIAAAVFILAIALKKIASIKVDDANRSLDLISKMLFSMVGVFFAITLISKISKTADFNSIGNMLLKLSVSLLIMVKVMQMIAAMDGKAIGKGIIVLGILSTFIVYFIAVSALAGEHASKAGTMLLKMSVAMLIMVAVIKLAGSLSFEEMAKGLAVIAGVGLIFSGFIAVSKMAGQYASKAGTMMLLMSAAILIAVIAIERIASISDSDIKKGLAVIAGIEIMFGAMVGLSKLSGKSADKAGSMLLMMSGAILVLAVAMHVLSLLDDEDLARSLAAIGVLEACFAGLIAATSIAKDSKGMMKILITMTVAILLMAAAIAALSFIDPVNLGVATAALDSIVTMFAGLVAVTRVAKNSKATLKTLLALTGIVAVLAGLIYLLSGIDDTSKALESAGALSILLLALSGSLVLLSKFGSARKNMNKMVGSMLLLGLVVAELGLVLAMMTALDAQNGIANATALSILLTAMTGVIVALDMLHISGGKKLASAIGMMALLGLVVAEIGLVLAMMTALNVSEAIPQAIALSILLLTMAAILPILALVGMTGAAAFVGIAAFAVLIVAIGGLIAGIGWLSEQFPELENFLDAGMPILAKIGEAIGSFFGNMVKGFSEAVASSLPGIATQLSLFMVNLTPFIMGAKLIDASVLAGIGIISLAFAALTAASLIDGLNKLLGFGTSFADLGRQLGDFMMNAMPFIIGLSAIDADAAVAAKSLAAVIIAISAGELISGIANFLGLQEDMTSFSSKLIPFGEAMVEFSSIVSGNIDSKAVTAAANAGKAMAGLANNLPTSSESLFGMLTHKTELDDFGDQIIPFGKAIVAFSDTVKGKVDGKAVESAANAGSVLASLADSMPEDPGTVFGTFTHKTELDDFGDQIIPFGKAIVAFSATVKGKVNNKAVESAANAGSVLASLANSMPDDPDTIFGAFSHKTELADFGNQIVPFGGALVAFSNTVKGNIDSKAVSSASAAGMVLSGLANSLPDDPDTVFGIFSHQTSMSDFAEQIVAFGKAMVEFSDSVSGKIDTSTVSTVIEAANNVSKMGAALSETTMDMSGLRDGLTTLGYSMVGFSTIISGNVDLEAVRIVSDVGKTLSEASRLMPQDADMARITNGLDDFAQAIIDFSDIVSGEEVDADGIKDAVQAGKSIAVMTSGIPANLQLTAFSNGLISLGNAMVKFVDAVNGTVESSKIEDAITAGNKINTFIAGVPEYKNLTKYHENAILASGAICNFYQGIKNAGIDKETITTATDAGTKISTYIDGIPEYKDLSNYSSNALLAGNAIYNFYQPIKNAGINKDTITTATDAGKELCDYISQIPEYKDVFDFTKNAGMVGAAVVSFYNHAKEIDKDTVINAVDAGKKIVEYVNDIPASLNVGKFISELPKLSSALQDFTDSVENVSAPDLSEFSEELGKLANSGIDAFVNKCNSSKGKVTNVGKELMSAFIGGMNQKGGEIHTTSSNLVSLAVRALSPYYTSFARAGSYLVEGFANGISASTWKAEAKARAMAKAAAQAAEDELDINSPSKVFRKIGYSVPEGFAMGIDRLSGMVKVSSETMADGAIEGTKSAISKIADVVNSDIDAQPVISPVLDLSDVKSGAAAMNGLFSTNPSVGVLSNVGTISTMMNRRSQNGANDDVISAIDGLRKELGNVGNTSYNINGITYDDGSNITEAIRTIVRAAKVERRV